MRSHRPKPGPQDPHKTPAQPGDGACRFDGGPVKALLSHHQATDQGDQPALIALARLLGRQSAREAAREGGGDE